MIRDFFTETDKKLRVWDETMGWIYQSLEMKIYIPRHCNSLYLCHADAADPPFNPSASVGMNSPNSLLKLDGNTDSNNVPKWLEPRTPSCTAGRMQQYNTSPVSPMERSLVLQRQAPTEPGTPSPSPLKSFPDTDILGDLSQLTVRLPQTSALAKEQSGWPVSMMGMHHMLSPYFKSTNFAHSLRMCEKTNPFVKKSAFYWRLRAYNTCRAVPDFLKVCANMSFLDAISWASEQIGRNILDEVCFRTCTSTFIGT